MFQKREELEIGDITEVKGPELRIDLGSDINELSRLHRGRIYDMGQFGSMIKIYHGKTILLSYVTLLRMRSELAEEKGLDLSVADDSRVLEASLFGEGRWDDRSQDFGLKRGVKTYPLPGQKAYLITRRELKSIYTGASNHNGSEKTTFSIGTYVGSSGTKCEADVDKLFGLHGAVLGSTGSGKSGTIASIMHSILDEEQQSDNDFFPNIVLLDPHGEYAAAFGDKAIIYKAYNESEKQNKDLLALPYWTMSVSEFQEFVLGSSAGSTQKRILAKALKHARLAEKGVVKEVPVDEGKDKWKHLGGDVEDVDLHPHEPNFTSQYDQDYYDKYDADVPDYFELDELKNHIKYGQTVRNQKGTWKDKTDTKRQTYYKLLDKIRRRERDPRLTFMMDPAVSTLSEVMKQFVGKLDKGTKIRIIDISGLDSTIAGVFTASVSRLLFQYKLVQRRIQRETDPVLFICEEAHRYVPDSGEAQYKTAQKSIQRVAREGRKYGLGLLLVSQRPSDVDGTVLSQCNSWIVLRLTNSTDQEHVKKFMPDSLGNLARLLPSLQNREALFLGDAALLPSRIYLKKLPDTKLPNSNNISFIDGWRTEPLADDELDSVIKRWCKN